MKRYTFAEFIAAYENGAEPDEDGYSFDNPDPSWIEHWKKYVPSLLSEQEVHDGDCTKKPYTCILCMTEMLLIDYHQYYFHEEEWRRNNL